MVTSNERTIAALTHLSALTQYFIPLGNFIFPIVIWSSKKNESEFIDYSGKQTLNFQLSVFLYSIILCLIAVPILIYIVFKNVTINDVFNGDEFIIENFDRGNFSGMVVLAIIAIAIFGFLKIIEFIVIIHAAVKASNGEKYVYPLSIPFFK